MPTKINEQRRFNSDSRLFYVWNQEKDGYDLKDTEFESSVIDIREINTKSSGYNVISMTDDGKPGCITVLLSIIQSTMKVLPHGFCVRKVPVEKWV